eukprot:GEMP01102861.1.p1 GENE.GEMP01102861.1~~GEMP01102861.1.p1  ORF type:complete len:121 (+),score=38.02 GEMP01102861.1:149-511(+)
MYDNVNEMLGRCHAERMARLQTTQRTMEVHGHGVVICERVGESIDSNGFFVRLFTAASANKNMTSLRALDAPVLMSFGRTREAEVDFWLAVEKLKPGAVVRELGEKTKLLDLRRCVSGAL